LWLKGQAELFTQALSAEAGAFAQANDLTFQRLGGLMWTVFGAARAFGQGGRFAGLITALPLADGVARTAELACGGLEPVSAGEGNNLLMEPVAVSAHAIQLKVGAVHATRMAHGARHCCASSGGGAAAHPCVVQLTP